MIFLLHNLKRIFEKLKACNAASYFCKDENSEYSEGGIITKYEMIHWLKTLRNFDGENEQRRIEQEKKTKKLLLTSRENNTLWSS